MMERAEEKSISPHERAVLLHNPSAIRCIFYYDLFMAQFARFGLAVYERIFNFYSDILHAICPDDPFLNEKKHTIHNAQEIEAMLKRLQPANAEVARTLGRLANACYSLSYGLYSDMNPQLTYDNFGPYPQPDGRMFAVKIFHNLRPVELWPETVKIPVDGIEIGALFEEVDLEVDCVTHAVYKGDQINGLRGWTCSMDGKTATAENVDTARKAIEESAIAIYEKVRPLDLEAKKELYWRQKAWGYKSLFDALELDWLPPEEVFQFARGKPLFQNWAIPEAKVAQVNFLREMIDPRTEIPDHCFKNV